MNNLIVAISGNAFAGKGTLANIIVGQLLGQGLKGKIFSFAYALKEDLDEFIWGKFGFSAFTQDPVQKSLIRPILIAYGAAQREKSNGQYWWKKVDSEIRNYFMTGGDVALIDDLRFDETATDELAYIQSCKGLVVSISRDGIGPAHISEEENIPKIRAAADFIIDWETTEDKQKQLDYCKDLLGEIFRRVG